MNPQQKIKSNAKMEQEYENSLIDPRVFRSEEYFDRLLHLGHLKEFYWTLSFFVIFIRLNKSTNNQTLFIFVITLTIFMFRSNSNFFDILQVNINFPSNFS